MADEVDDFFFGSSSPTCSFKELGRTYEGVIEAKKMEQARDIKDRNKLLFWDDGQPKKQAVFTLRTEERDPKVENDDGRRRLFIGSKGQKEAMQAALKAANVRTVAIGGTIKIQYVADGEATNPGLDPPKIFRAKYTPPAEDFGDREEDWGGPADTEDLSMYSEEPF